MPVQELLHLNLDDPDERLYLMISTKLIGMYYYEGREWFLFSQRIKKAAMRMDFLESALQRLNKIQLCPVYLFVGVTNKSFLRSVIFVFHWTQYSNTFLSRSLSQSVLPLCPFIPACLFFDIFRKCICRYGDNRKFTDCLFS